MTEIKDIEAKTKKKSTVKTSKKSVKVAKKRIKQDENFKILNANSVVKWLIENTILTFEQIANSTGVDILDVNAISDGFIANSTPSIDPIFKGYFTRDDIETCQKDPNLNLTYLQHSQDLFSISTKHKYSYTPMISRYNKISGAMWVFLNYPKVPTQKVVKLLKVSRSIAESIRDKTYKNVYNLTHQDPVGLDLCNIEDFNEFCEENKIYKVKMESNQ